MQSLKDAKYLGGVGSLLLLLTLVPNAGLIFLLVGLALVAIAVKKISDATGDRSIFNNFVLSIIIVIIGGAAATVSAVALGLVNLVSFFNSIIAGGIDQFDPTGPEVFDLAVRFLTILFVAIIIVWISLIASSIFLRRSYNSISKKINAGLFSTLGLLYLIGAATTIILIGFAIILVAAIIQIIAFFTIPEELPAQQPGTLNQTL